MFENVPVRLSNYIKQTPPELYREGWHLLYLIAVSGVVAEYLQKNFLAPSNDPYLGQQKIDEAGKHWFGYPMRIMLIGTTLFRLRSCSGFSEFCRRLKGRDLRATFYETLAAK